jgi:hypothetical protein
MDIEKGLEDALSRLMTDCRKIQYLQTINIDPTLQSFIKRLQKANETQLYYFKEKYQGELQRMKPIIAKTNRSLHDKIYNKLQISRYTSHVTSLFEEFIKGITYFEHRQGNLICTAELSKHEIQRRRPLIERCYIERLIYDEIYKYYTFHFPTKNDSPNLFCMKLTKEDFESCFPDTQIVVNIDHEDNVPVRATIVRTNNSKHTTMVFRKYVTLTPIFGVKTYEENVEVEKKDSNGRTYIKTSRFNNPGKFVAVVM